MSSVDEQGQTFDSQELRIDFPDEPTQMTVRTFLNSVKGGVRPLFLTNHAGSARRAGVRPLVSSDEQDEQGQTFDSQELRIDFPDEPTQMTDRTFLNRDLNADHGYLRVRNQRDSHNFIAAMHVTASRCQAC